MEVCSEIGIFSKIQGNQYGRLSLNVFVQLLSNTLLHFRKLFLNYVLENLLSWFITRPDRNQAVQPHKMVRGLDRRMIVNYLCRENKGIDVR